MHYLLMYESVVPDYAARRTAFRDEHLAAAWAAHARGELVLGGAFADPYVRNGLVTKWRVRKWTTVVGDDAAMPTGKR
jgi:uncharacterized protein